MNYLSCLPSSPLKRYVKAYLVFDDTHETFAKQILSVFPGTHTEIVFSFGDAVDFITPEPYHLKRCSAYVGGHTQSPVTYRPSAALRIVGVILTPLGLWHLLSVPPRHLLETKVDLETVLGQHVRLLYERLYEAPTHRLAIKTIEEFLLSRITDREHQKLAPFLRCIEMTHGKMSLSRYSDRAGISIRTLERCFIEHFGFTAKQMCRLARFSHAFNLVNSAPTNWWAVIAECGYTDQSHFIKEFSAFTHFTPARYLTTAAQPELRHSLREMVTI